MESVITSVQTFVNDLLNQAPIVITTVLGLFAVIFGLRFVLRLVKTASK